MLHSSARKMPRRSRVIKRMVRDLNLPVEIVVCPIVRETDGLAMSSRNAYLDAQQRKQALVLHRSLQRVKELVDAGERSSAKLARGRPPGNRLGKERQAGLFRDRPS